MSLENTTNEEVISLASAPIEELEVAEAQYDAPFAGIYKSFKRVLGSTSKKVSSFIDSYSDRLKSNLAENKENHAVPYSQRQKGFTLTELLVTIAITGGLMAILLPSLQRVRKEAKSTVCQSNERQWGIIFNAEEEISSLSTTFHHYYDKWWSYVSNLKSFSGDCNDMLLCPMATKRGTLFSPLNKSRYGSTFASWAWIRTLDCEPVFGSYGFNNQLAYGPQFSPASSVPVLFDCILPEACLTSDHNPPPKYKDMSIIGANDIESLAPRICINRHDGGINMLFLDEHVRKVGLKELWTLKWHRYFDTTGPWTKAGGVKPEDWPKWMRNFKDY